jgi:hypothetical protein
MEGSETIMDTQSYSQLCSFEEAVNIYIEAMTIQNDKPIPQLRVALRGGFTAQQIQVIFRILWDMPRLNKDIAHNGLMRVMDANTDGLVDIIEWGNQKTGRLLAVRRRRFKLEYPDRFTRFSTQAWLNGLGSGEKGSKLSVAKRIATLLGLPSEALTAAVEDDGHETAFGESAQVVRYEPKGHYTCHHDSSAADSNPANRTRPRHRSFARAYTVLIQLKEVPNELGGETWFPGAMRGSVTEKWEQGDWERLEHQCTLNNSCVDGVKFPM